MLSEINFDEDVEFEPLLYQSKIFKKSQKKPHHPSKPKLLLSLEGLPKDIDSFDGEREERVKRNAHTAPAEHTLDAILVADHFTGTKPLRNVHHVPQR